MIKELQTLVTKLDKESSQTLLETTKRNLRACATMKMETAPGTTNAYINQQFAILTTLDRHSTQMNWELDCSLPEDIDVETYMWRRNCGVMHDDETLRPLDFKAIQMLEQEVYSEIGDLINRTEEYMRETYFTEQLESLERDEYGPIVQRNDLLDMMYINLYAKITLLERYRPVRNCLSAHDLVWTYLGTLNTELIISRIGVVFYPYYS